MTITSIPVTGTDENGAPINLVATDAGTVANQNISAQRAPTPLSWALTEIKSLYKSGTNMLGLGYGIDSTNTKHNLIWINRNGSWFVGKLGDASAIRPDAIGYFSNQWLMSYGGQTYVANVDSIVSSTPAGSMSETPVDFRVATQSPMAVSAFTIGGGNLVAIGSFNGVNVPSGAVTEKGKWINHFTDSVFIETCAQDTSYTFPGYAGANPQIHFANAVPKFTTIDNHTVDLPPDQWHVEHINAEGYYGLIGCECPSLTVNWTEVRG
jgi:hypothetical protein